jgi:hypothetical protein
MAYRYNSSFCFSLFLRGLQSYFEYGWTSVVFAASNNFTMSALCNNSLSLYSPFVGPWPIFGFLILYTVDTTSWMGDQPVARNTEQHKQNKRTQTSMPRVGFEPTIPEFEQTKPVHALDCAATVIGNSVFAAWIFNEMCQF